MAGAWDAGLAITWSRLWDGLTGTVILREAEGSDTTPEPDAPSEGDGSPYTPVPRLKTSSLGKSFFSDVRTVINMSHFGPTKDTIPVAICKIQHNPDEKSET